MQKSEGIVGVFERSFEELYAYVYRRVDDKEFIEEILRQIYARLTELEGIEDMDEERTKLIAYRTAYNFLKERALFAANEEFWKDLTIEEAEVLRLRFLEELSSFEIAIILHEQAGKLDAFLYATLMKAKEIFPVLNKKKQVGAYFSELNAHFREMKEQEHVVIPQDLKIRLAENLFNYDYNLSREMQMPEMEEVPQNDTQKDRPEVGDFFNKPMKEDEQKQFVADSEAVLDRHPEWALKNEEQWVPENKPTSLPEDNPEGYGMDLLKTFSKAEEKERKIEEMEQPVKKEDLVNPFTGESLKTDEELIAAVEDDSSAEQHRNLELNAISESVAIRQKINVADAQPQEEAAQPNYEVPDSFGGQILDEDQEENKFKKWRKGLVSPILALLVVVLGTIYFPFEYSHTETDYKLIYTDVFLEKLPLDEQEAFLEGPLEALLEDRGIKSVELHYPRKRNISIKINLKNGNEENMLFYKMIRGEEEKWVMRTYKLIERSSS